MLGASPKWHAIIMTQKPDAQRKLCQALPCAIRPAPERLAAKAMRVYSMPMTQIINIGDRARLRERFFGSTHTVLARL